MRVLHTHFAALTVKAVSAVYIYINRRKPYFNEQKICGRKATYTCYKNA